MSHAYPTTAKTHLRPGVLAPNGQTHGVPPATVGSHISQPLDVVLQGPPQIIFNLHGGQFGGQVGDLAVAEGANLCGRVDVMARHYADGDLGADAVEGLESLLDQVRAGEVGAVEELLAVSVWLMRTGFEAAVD